MAVVLFHSGLYSVASRMPTSALMPISTPCTWGFYEGNSRTIWPRVKKPLEGVHFNCDGYNILYFSCTATIIV